MLPLSLYIHMPWCIRKCPYCDFNSHKSPGQIPEEEYIQALLADVQYDLLQFAQQRQLTSIFFGGGTPSLFAASSYDVLLRELRVLFDFPSDMEITLEANPGTVDLQRFDDYRRIGINRLSIGIQSFNKRHLQALGRIHDDEQAHRAISAARRAGFDNINIDIMYGLPQQTIEEGLADLRTALSYKPEHLSWYQLTIEPNTLFYKAPPALPLDDSLALLESQGLEILRQDGMMRYEISAFCRDNLQATHNVNYWLFGDYLGIGAGAHGKLTSADGVNIYRTRKHRTPVDYLNPNKPFCCEVTSIDAPTRVFEFMLNATRLEQKITKELFSERTGLAWELLLVGLIVAEKKGLLTVTENYWHITPLGRRYTNDLQAIFL